MNNDIMRGFTDELQKTALLPVSVVRGLTKFKVWRAGRAGEKSIIREAGRRASQAGRKGGKEVGALGQVDDLIETVRNTRVQEGKAILEGGKNVPTGGKGFLSRHKGKLLLGGAAVGGLYLANKSSENDEEKRRAMLASRNMNIPQRVYYQ